MSSKQLVIGLCLIVGLGSQPAHGQWDPFNGEWKKSFTCDLRVMTWNVEDGICSTNSKVEGLNNWTALAVIVASIRPDILIIQEAGDNDGNGTGSGGDSITDLETTVDLFLNGGADPFNGGSVTAYVRKYAPGYSLPHIWVSADTDGFNRNVIVSRYPFTDLNGDTKDGYDDIPFVLPDEYAPGGTGGIRGFQFAEIDMPNARYNGDVVIGNCHLKSGSSSSDKQDRLEASQNVAYFIDYLYNGAGTGIPDPNVKILDVPPALNILDPDTAIIWGGDWNEDEATNGRKGPAEWFTLAEFPEPTDDGTDRDGTDAMYDIAAEPISGNTDTLGSSKLDYIAWQDSIVTSRREFIFDSGELNNTQTPDEILDNFSIPLLASSFAADHLPVIVDFEMDVIGICPATIRKLEVPVQAQSAGVIPPPP